jgi:hypothetical protein
MEKNSEKNQETSMKTLTQALIEYSKKEAASLTSFHRIKGGNRKLKVNINDLKKFNMPDTRTWKIGDKYLKEAAEEFRVPSINNAQVMINFQAIESMIQDFLDDKLPDVEYFIIPDWPCMSWYNRFCIKRLKQKLFDLKTCVRMKENLSDSLHGRTGCFVELFIPQANYDMLKFNSNQI